MANNVYIGARYVPIFDGDWNSAKVYEPLTIVNYVNASYTSKRQVPAGIVPTNPEYWAMTGNYNAQISEFIERVEDLEDEVADVEDGIAKDKVFPYKNIVIIADSWGIENTNFRGWLPQFLASLPTFVTHHEVAISGGGFTKTGDLNYLTRFQTLGNSITDKTAVDLIFVQGFDNDTESGTIYSAMTAFCDYAITNYPNAHIVIANASQNLPHTYNENVSKFAAEANIAGYRGRVAFANFGGCWNPRARFDTSHLTTEGFTQLTRNIYNYLVSGNIEGWYGASALGFTGSISGSVYFIGCGNMIDITTPGISNLSYSGNVTAGGEINLEVPLNTELDSSTPDLGTCAVACTIGGTKYATVSKVAITNTNLVYRIMIPASGAMTNVAVQTNRYRVPRNYF